MKKKEIAVNIMRKVAKNGRFTTKEEELMNFFILNYNRKGTATEPFKNTFEQYSIIDNVKKDSEQMKKVYDYILNFIQKETRGGKRQGAGRKKLLESDKIQKKQVSLELTIVEFEKLTDHCTANNTSKNALLKDLLKKEDII